MSSFLQALFRTSPTEHEKKQNDDDNNNEEEEETEELSTQKPRVPQPEEEEEEENAMETQEDVFETQPQQMHVVRFPPPLMQRRSFGSSENNEPTEKNRQRLRSITKVFTSLPDTLPDHQTMMVDQVEYWCHVILLETQPEKIASHKIQLGAARNALSQTHQADKLFSKGRLYSRLALTAAASDTSMLQLDGGDVEHAESGIRLASELTSNDWNMAKEHLILVKGDMQRKNADVVIDVGACDSAPGSPKKTTGEGPDSGDDWPDPDLAQHAMMTTDFQEVLRLFSVQFVLCELRERLHAIKNDSIGSPGGRHGRPSPARGNLMTKPVERAVNHYMKSLSNIFSATEDDDSCGEAIPKELNSFLLHDIYSPKKPTKNAKQSGKMVDRLLHHISSITNDTSTPIGARAGTYSYANLQQMVRSLLIKWSESILEVPTLVKLGYGGVMSPIIDNDEDDVSSLGDGEHTQPETQLDRPHQRRTRKSIARILIASMKGRGRSFSVTDEERDIIAQLAEVTGASARIRSDSTEVANRERSQGSTTSKDAATQTSQPDAGAGPTAGAVSLGTKSPPLPSSERKRSASGLKAPPQGARTSDRVPADNVRREERLSDEESESSDSDESVKVVKLSVKVMKLSRRTGSRSEKKAFPAAVAELPEKEKRARDSSDDDDSSGEAPRKAVKLSRRLNDWVSSKRRKREIRGATDHSSGGDASSKENATPASKKKKSPQKTRLAFSDDEDAPVMSPPKSPKTRKGRCLFTADEDCAIVDGVTRYGKGKWKQIKDNDARLKNREPGQIKDRYRNLMRQV